MASAFNFDGLADEDEDSPQLPEADEDEDEDEEVILLNDSRGLSMEEFESMMNDDNTTHRWTKLNNETRQS